MSSSPLFIRRHPFFPFTIFLFFSFPFVRSRFLSSLTRYYHLRMIFFVLLAFSLIHLVSPLNPFFLSPCLPVSRFLADRRDRVRLLVSQFSSWIRRVKSIETSASLPPKANRRMRTVELDARVLVSCEIEEPLSPNSPMYPRLIYFHIYPFCPLQVSLFIDSNWPWFNKIRMKSV